MKYKKGIIATTSKVWMNNNGMINPYYVICTGNKATEQRSFKAILNDSKREYSLLYEAYKLYTDIFVD